MSFASGRSLRRIMAIPGTPLGCCSVYNMETIQAVVRAAELERAPVLLSIDDEGIRHAGLGPLGQAALLAARDSSQPVGAHLNHCRDMDALAQALRMGFSSVMFDGSALKLEENMLRTREAAHLAHEADACMEGEIGPLPCGGSADAGKAFLDAAQRFVHETGVDVLAVSAPKGGLADLRVLAELCERMPGPVCIHGASGLGPGGAATAAAHGVRKVNFHSEIKTAFLQGLLAADAGPLERVAAARDAVTVLVRRKLRDMRGQGAQETP